MNFKENSRSFAVIVFILSSAFIVAFFFYSAQRAWSEAPVRMYDLTASKIHFI